jgi:hypothetical protein
VTVPLHETYLPFTAEQLGQHFAPVSGAGLPDRHLKYYRASIGQADKYDDLVRNGRTPTPAQIRHGRQMEKDERFWVATALMNLYHADPGAEPRETLWPAAAARRAHANAGVRNVGGGAARAPVSVLRGQPPFPRAYRDWVRHHLGERTPIPYVSEAATVAGTRLEGKTNVDAMLLAPRTGVMGKLGGLQSHPPRLMSVAGNRRDTLNPPGGSARQLLRTEAYVLLS